MDGIKLKDKEEYRNGKIVIASVEAVNIIGIGILLAIEYGPVMGIAFILILSVLFDIRDWILLILLTKT